MHLDADKPKIRPLVRRGVMRKETMDIIGDIITIAVGLSFVISYRKLGQ